MPEPDRAAADGGAASAQGGDHELSGRAERGAGGDQPSRRSRRRHPPIAFSRELYIEHDDFMENPPKKFFRLSPGNEVRLRYAYFIKCTDVVKNAAGEVVELRCTYDPATKGGNAPDGRKVKATMHWLSAKHSSRRKSASTTSCSPTPRRTPPILPRISTRNPSRFCRMRGSSRRSWKPIRLTQCSSSGRAISCAMPLRRRIARCSTGPSACATPLPRKSAARDR